MSAKLLIRNIVAEMLFFLNVTSPARRSIGLLSIITFHRVLPGSDLQNYPFKGLVVTPEDLNAFLSYFTKHFDCGTLASQHKRFMHGETTTRPLLAITFDDAQYDNFQYAQPILDHYNIKASFFVPVVAVQKGELLWHDRLGFSIQNLLNQPNGIKLLSPLLNEFGLHLVGGEVNASKVVVASKELTLEARLSFVEALSTACGKFSPPDFARLMTFEEIQELANSGHEIGSHSMTHCMMPECDDRSLEYEVSESLKILNSRLTQPIDTFCYPNGDSDERSANAVAKAGYLRAVTTDWGSNGIEIDRYRLRRFDMVTKHVLGFKNKFMPALLALRMSGLYPGLGK